MMHLRNFYSVVLLMLLVLTSCQNETVTEQNQDRYALVSISVPVNKTAFRALPPSGGGAMLPGETRVDCVRLILLRRPTGSLYDFTYYDSDNNQGAGIVLTSYTPKTETDGNQLRLFTHRVRLELNCEYKIVALGYSSRDGGSNATQDGLFLSGRYEENMFTVPLENGVTTLSGLEFKLKQIQGESALKQLGTAELDMPYGTNGITSPSYDVTPFYVFNENLPDGGIWDDSELGTGIVSSNDILSQVCAPAPELYYAICTNKDGNEILSATDTGITGVLYRGMAKVQVEVPVPVDGNDVKWIALLANNVNTVSGLSSYDDFHDANTPVESSTEEYTLLSVAQPVEGKVTLQAYVLPTVTNLAAIAYGDFDSDNKMEHSFFPINTNAYTEGDNATGVITVITDGDKFNFKRNKFYKITYNSFGDLVY